MCGWEGGRTILFISDWISLSDNAPRDMVAGVGGVYFFV